MTKSEMGEAIVRRCRELGERNRRNNSNWRWGDQYEAFSKDCGIEVAPPDASDRRRFSAAMHVVIPEEDYSFKAVYHKRLELVDAILAFHGRPTNSELLGDSTDKENA